MKSRYFVMRSRLFRTAAAGLLLSAGLSAVLSVVGCGEKPASEKADGPAVVEANGSIRSEDMQDPDHSDLFYDTYAFAADAFDRVRLEVVTQDFTPLLKLVETATGAPLSEWDERYSDEDALTYTIAGPGTYEARVYAIDGREGDYRLRVTVNE